MNLLVYRRSFVESSRRLTLFRRSFASVGQRNDKPLSSLLSEEPNNKANETSSLSSTSSLRPGSLYTVTSASRKAYGSRKNLHVHTGFSLPSQTQSTSTNEKNGDSNEASQTQDSNLPRKVSKTSILEESTKGVGQVIFLNSTTSGTILLAGLCVGDVHLATLAALGALQSQYVARSCSTTSHQSAVTNGLWSYNGCLVGCATAVFVAPLADTSTWMSTVTTLSTGVAVTTLGATVATFGTVALGNSFSKMPQWTYAFNAVALSLLLHAQPFAASTTEALAVPTITDSSLLATPLVGLSQIFVVESAWTGVAVLAAIGRYSPQLALHALLGSTVGSVVGATLYGAPMPDIVSGLWGYNSALTSMGVGVFFMPTSASWVLSAGGAVATAGCFAALSTVFGSWDAPCLTLPFCLTMSACYQLAGSVESLQLAAEPHSPERNVKSQ